MTTRPLALLFALLLAPAVHAGTSSTPELTDARGDAPAPLDVVAAWWSPAPAPAFTERDVPKTGVQRVDEVAFIRYPAGDRVQLVVQLADVTTGQPALGGAGHVRHYYTLRFTPGDWGAEIAILCLVNYADTAVPLGRTPYYESYNEVTRVGLACTPEEDSQTGAPYTTDAALDLETDRLVVTIIERDAAIGPGSTFSGLSVETGVGLFSLDQRKFTRTVADTAEGGADYSL